MKINLSIRMKMNASLVPDSDSVADIGCDHGFVSIWLCENKKPEKIIASDVNEGPLNHAKKNIEKTGLSDKIETRLGDGLSVLKPGEADTVLIAGVGGMLICEMLSGAPDVLKEVKTLVLQPQSDIEEVRRHLHKVGFYIDRESICLEDDKYYIAIRAKRGEEKTPYSDSEYRYSRLLSEEGGSVYKGYIKRMTDKLSDLLKTLDMPDLDLGDRALSRKEDLERELKEFRDYLK